MDKLEKGLTITDPQRQIVYVLDNFIGEGSFGEVWLAHEETDSSKRIAIKFYIPLDDSGRRLFFEEYKSSANLNHPNLLNSLFYGEWDRRPYIGMQYCKNGSSSKLVGNLSPDDSQSESMIWRFIRDTAAGLQYLHEKEDLVHQDIKPDNILIDSDGNFVIMDFGISAKARATLRSQSKRSNSAGAPAYMAPERFTRKPSVLYASDIWSLGVSIYELTTGELPFNGMGGGLLNAGAELPILPNGWSKDLNGIMQICLSKDTWDRKRAGEIKEYANWILSNKQGLPPFEVDNYKNESENKSDVCQNPTTEHFNVEEKQNSHIYRYSIIAVVACVIFIIVFVFASKSQTEKIAEFLYPTYQTLVLNCQDSIENGSTSSPYTLLNSKQILSQIKDLEDKYWYVYPDKYNQFYELDRMLSPKLQEASNIWADAAKRQYDETKDLALSIHYSQLAVNLNETERSLYVYNYIASGNAYMNIQSIKFANSDDLDFSLPLQASTLKYLKPRIEYEGLVKESIDVELDVKIIQPNGSLSKSSSSQGDYTYHCTERIYPGMNTLDLTGWGSNTAGVYAAGTHIFELWYNGNKFYSKRFRVL